ncbi:hypothetical protein [Propionimicrobium sp. PCR01-08-3]|uniref:hypothetical protein n=1 Tax=Propionimicrobium sp. PCR01-08-3 TaxID=3052086 RepID=UPI00255C7431|nr:hypothetical protein [Propionimicrobium sp. PCR01-08-3]WIY83945.1 hypothetical protein QQ658_06275 [Propionimicrobium sp. PCR01-08-3]
MARAATTRLEPGQHSIDRATPFAYRDGWALKWRLRLPSGKLVEKLTQGPTKGAVRSRAKATAAKLLAAPGNTAWSPTSPVLDYMEKVTAPAIQTDRLSDSTTRRYALALRLLRGECRTSKCKHKHSLAGLSLHDAMRSRNLKACLEEIAQLHGRVNAKHAKTVAKRYLAAPLKIDEIIEYNPLIDLDLDLSDAKRPTVDRGGHALTMDEYRRVIDHLLAADPTAITKARQGRWTVEQLVRQRGQVIDVILTQATTGMRTSELCQRTKGDVEVDKDGTVVFNLSPEATKTRSGRKVPVLDPRVSARLVARLGVISDKEHPLFPSPTNPEMPWDPRARDRKLAPMYQHLAEELEIPLLEYERGHVWRATLNTLLFDRIPEAARIRLLGHTEAVNRQFYTAVTDTKSVVQAAAVLRGDPEK